MHCLSNCHDPNKCPAELPFEARHDEAATTTLAPQCRPTTIRSAWSRGCIETETTTLPALFVLDLPKIFSGCSFFCSLLPPRSTPPPTRYHKRRRAMGASDSRALALLAFLAVLHGARSRCPSSAPAPAPAACGERLRSLTACSTYVEEGSNLTRPRKGCCPSLAGVVRDEPACLCRLIGHYDGDGDGVGVGVRVDATRALMLPAACHVDAPPMSLCAVLSTPMSSPSPASGAPEVLEAPPAGSSPSWASGTPRATPPPNKSSGYTALGAFNGVFLLLCSLPLL